MYICVCTCESLWVYLTSSISYNHDCLSFSFIEKNTHIRTIILVTRNSWIIPERIRSPLNLDSDVLIRVFVLSCIAARSTILMYLNFPQWNWNNLQKDSGQTFTLYLKHFQTPQKNWRLSRMQWRIELQSFDLWWIWEGQI